MALLGCADFLRQSDKVMWVQIYRHDFFISFVAIWPVQRCKSSVGAMIAFFVVVIFSHRSINVLNSFCLLIMHDCYFVFWHICTIYTLLFKAMVFFFKREKWYLCYFIYPVFNFFNMKCFVISIPDFTKFCESVPVKWLPKLGHVRKKCF